MLVLVSQHSSTRMPTPWTGTSSLQDAVSPGDARDLQREMIEGGPRGLKLHDPRVNALQRELRVADDRVAVLGLQRPMIRLHVARDEVGAVDAGDLVGLMPATRGSSPVSWQFVPTGGGKGALGTGGTGGTSGVLDALPTPLGCSCTSHSDKSPVRAPQPTVNDATPDQRPPRPRPGHRA